MVSQSPILDGRFSFIQSEAHRLGGTAYVCKARDLTDDQEVAIKIFEGDIEDGMLRKIYENDVSSLRALRHENVVRYIHHGRTSKGQPYLATEWIQKSLKEYLAEQTDGRISLRETFRTIGLPLVEAIAYAHSLKPTPVEHRDISLGNVMLRAGSIPVLIDFGIGKAQNDVSEDLTTMQWTSPLYSPPWSRTTDRRFVRDVYSLGLLLLRCAHGDSLSKFEHVAPALEAVGARNPKLGELLRQCISNDPTSIFANGVELLAEYRTVLQSAVASEAAKTRNLRLELLNNAVEHVAEDLSGNPSKAEVLRQLIGELTSGYSVEFKLKADKSGDDRNQIQIGTSERILVGEIDRATGTISVYRAFGKQYAQLEDMRRRALWVSDELPIVISGQLDLGLAKTGIEWLVQAIDDHASSKLASMSIESEEARDYVESLDRILDIREKLANSALASFRIYRVSQSSNGLEVDLADSEDDADRDYAEFGEEVEIVSSDGETVIARGDLAYQSGDQLVVIPRGRVGNLKDASRVRPSRNATFQSLKRQRQALLSIATHESANSHFRDILNDPKLSTFDSSISIQDWFSDFSAESAIDDDKKRAVLVALQSESFSLVQGPPGTGKTALITELVQQTLRINPAARILLVSQTHVAVDNALERLAASGVKGMVRLARPERKLSSATESFRLDLQAEQWREDVRTRSVEFLEAELAAYNLDHSRLRSSQILGELRSLLDTQHRLERDLERAKQDKGQYTTLTIGPYDSENQDDYEDSLKSINVRRATLVEQLNTHSPSWLKLSLDSPELLEESQLRTIQHSLVPPTEESEAVQSIVDMQSEWLERLTTDNTLIESFLSSRSVLAGTAIGFIGLKNVSQLSFDLCIIDEASKATANELMVPIAKSLKVLLVGDSKQLPPLSEYRSAKDLAKDAHVSQAAFDETLFEYFENSLPSELITNLSTQYRMVQGIGSLVSDCFYGGALLSSGRASNPKLEQFQEKPVLWINTSSLHADSLEQQAKDSTSFHNPAEVQIIIQRLVELDKSLVASQSEPMEIDVLVISPYKVQVNALSRAIRMKNWEMIDPECLSIDQVQGRQADVVFLSLVRSNTNSKVGFLSDWRRLNVALSRAKYLLTVVGNLDFCLASKSRLGSVAQYVTDHDDQCLVQEAKLYE
jgi:serine/threonine protein kinase